MITDKFEEGIKHDLPPAGMNVMIQCNGFRCLAYRTQEGKWMSTFRHEELNEVQHVFPFDEPARLVIPVTPTCGAPRRSRVAVEVLPAPPHKS